MTIDSSQRYLRRKRLNGSSAQRFSQAMDAAYFSKEREPDWQDVGDALSDVLVDALHFAYALREVPEPGSSGSPSPDPAAALAKELLSIAEGAVLLYQEEAKEA